jgi:excinuclease ABC subunit C
VEAHEVGRLPQPLLRRPPLCPTIRSVTPELEATLKNLPDRPGVYLMKDARGGVVYVGKAQSLRHRVRSYWQKHPVRGGLGDVHRIREVIDRVADVDYTLTDSVGEALLLEGNLVKRYQPLFNVRLKDDKSYPYIKITLGDDFPRIERTRKLPNDGSRYFGPYASASSIDEAMNLVRRLFPFRTCTIDIKDGVRALQRPCLLYHIKRCQGPCIEAISKEDYRADNQAAVQLFVIRGGKALGRDVFLLDTPRGTTDAEVVSGFLLQYYGRASSVPREIAIPFDLPDAADLERFLADRRAAGGTTAAVESPTMRVENLAMPRPDAVRVARTRARAAGAAAPVRLVVPQRGERRQLVQLATRNAEEMLAREQARWLADQGKTLAALEQLADALEMSGPPMRIECYDISNFQGRESVGSMVVFEEGKPRSGEYRRFRIRTVSGPNDFASHQEVLRRRFRRARAGDEGSEEERRWKMPDLVIVDGGKGQVSAAKEVLDELGLHDMPLAGLAKEREELFLPDRAEPILLPATSSALYLVQRIRDEAHRFAITYHRDLRAKSTVRSAFDDMPGVGPKRRQALLRVFGSAKRVREAPVEQIAAVPGISRALAEKIKASLEA